jgi:DNA-binding NtrC family response regulator
MTRALVVHHDIDIADQEADSLRRMGYEVEQCTGPAAYSCPVMRGEPCLAVQRADVLVYDVLSTSESGGSQALVAGLRDLYPDIPVVLTASGIELDWVETEGPHRVVPLVGSPTAVRLDAAIREALGATGGGP